MSIGVHRVSLKEIEVVTKIVSLARGYRPEIGVWKAHHHLEGGKVLVEVENGTLIVPLAVIQAHLAGAEMVESFKYLAISETFAPPKKKRRFSRLFKRK